MPDDYSSFNHALFSEPRAEFERTFESFLTSLATPVETRREVAIETVKRLGAIVTRLIEQGAL